MFPLQQLLETDQKLKDIEWANKMCTFIRMYMQPLVNIEKARKGMDYLTGSQDMSSIRDLFMAPDSLNLDNRRPSRQLFDQYNKPLNQKNKGDLDRYMEDVDFVSVPVMEKVRAMITAEIKKMGVILEAYCTDPTATTKRFEDRELLKNWDKIDGLLKYYYSAIGMPDVSMDTYEQQFGERLGNGNVSEFKNMELQSSNPGDIKFFMELFHKLSAEIAATTVIDQLMKANQIEEVFFDNWVNDFISKKAISVHHHVSKLNGRIIDTYLAPEIVSVLGGGRRKDMNDATAKAYEQRVTIKELLDRVGDSFVIEDNMDLISQAIYLASGNQIEITKIGTDARVGWWAQDRSGTRYNQESFMNLKIIMGYMEFISPDDTDYSKVLDGIRWDKSDDKRKAKKDLKDMGHQPPNGKRYQNKARYEVPTYCMYYVALSNYSQKIFDFGYVPYANIEGYNDVDANWTILTYKEIGDPIAIMCAPYIDIINETWYKFKEELRRAKPKGMAYNYDSILEIANVTFTDTKMSLADKINRVIQFLDSSANSVYKWPEVDGKIYPIANNQMNIEQQNGISESAMKYWEAMNSAWEKMLSVIGLDAPLRQGDPGGSRDSMNNQFKALEYSQNNTYYIPDGITYLCQMLASRNLMYVQDIIYFNDIDTMAYEALVDLAGEDVLRDIAAIGKKALHRYGINVLPVNSAGERAKIQARIDISLQNGKISNAESALIETIKSPQRQAVVLAAMEQRNAALAQRNAMDMERIKNQAAMQQLQAQKELEMIKSQTQLEAERIKANAAIQGHLITQQGGIDKMHIKQAADIEQAYHNANAKTYEQQQMLNQTGKTTPIYPTPTPYPLMPQAEPAKSALAQNVESSQTMPTEAA